MWHEVIHVACSLSMHILAGGSEGPMVQWLAYMGKEYGENVTLGSEVMQCLVQLQISKAQLFPMISVTDVCLGKPADGIAKLVFKTDIMNLKSKKMETTVKDCEEFLTQAWKDAEASGHETAVWYKTMAVASMRVILMMFKKEKLGKEPDVIYTLGQIRALFN